MSKPWEKYQASAPETGPWAKYGSEGLSDFENYVSRVLKLEGGYANDPEDRGGETKYGISKAAHPDVDIPSLTVADAKRIYKEQYWDKIGASQLPESLRGMAFDAAVNQGVGWTKRALRKVGNDAQAFLQLRARRYARIVSGDSTQKKFARGWEKRLEEFSGPWLRYGGKK